MLRFFLLEPFLVVEEAFLALVVDFTSSEDSEESSEGLRVFVFLEVVALAFLALVTGTLGSESDSESDSESESGALAFDLLAAVDFLAVFVCRVDFLVGASSKESADILLAINRSIRSSFLP